MSEETEKSLHSAEHPKKKKKKYLYLDKFEKHLTEEEEHRKLTHTLIHRVRVQILVLWAVLVGAITGLLIWWTPQ